MKFTKMQGAGNDFLLIDGFKNNLCEIVPKIKNLCDRRFGVGGDGVIIALPSEISDVKMYYYNSDGSQGEMCGNGIRCFAKFVYEKGIVKKDILKIETLAGIQTAVLKINAKDIVEKIEIEIGNIKYAPEDIVVDVKGENAFNKKINIDGREIEFFSVFLGVPHTVIFIDKEDQYDVNETGRKIEVHPVFPKKTNVDFVLPISDDEIKIFTWERGAGRTLACGTGSSSSALLCHKLKGMKNRIKVVTEGGDLEVEILDDTKVKLIGTAGISFEGEVDLKNY